MATRIAIRRDTAANWAAANPILVDGEPALETDTARVKYGDGSRHYTALPYSGTSPAELAAGIAAETTRANGAYTPIGDAAYATLDLAVAATPAGGTLEITQAWTKTLPLSIAKAMTLRFRGGSITQTTDTAAIDITSDNVLIENAKLTGVGAATSGTGAAIRCVSVVGDPRKNIRIRGGLIDGWKKYGIYLEQVTGFTVDSVVVQNIAYAGVIVLSGKDGHVDRNTIINLTQPTPFVNSYGIALTRNSSQNLATAPRSSDITVHDNTIDGVNQWESIDTHGGERLIITNNTIRNGYIGIALVPCPDTSGNDAYAPKGCFVDGNILESGKTDGSTRAGIQLVGCVYPDVDTVVEYASAIITNNTVIGWGTENSSNQGGIFLQTTRGAVVQGNRVVNASPNAIVCYHNNQGGVIADNILVDTWTNSLSASALVYFSSVHQTMTVRGNIAVRADKTATIVNQRGLWFAGALAAPDVLVRFEGNNFTACSLPLVDSPTTQNITELRMEARKATFAVGGTPIVRPTVPAAATDLATAIALVNALRTATNNYGLTS